MGNSLGSHGTRRGRSGAVRGGGLPGTEVILGNQTLIRAEIDQGALLTAGSLLSCTRFTLEAALYGSREEGIQDALSGAFFGLSPIRAAKDLGVIAGGLADEAELDGGRSWQMTGRAVTCDGRIDSRRHFAAACCDIRPAAYEPQRAAIGAEIDKLALHR